MNLFYRICIAILLLLTVKCLVAQDGTAFDQDSIITHTLSEVVITASRHNSVSLNTSEAISILGSKPIQNNQLRSAPEALMLMPGVFVQKTNHGGGSPFLRGLTGNQTLLLIDGIRLSNATVRYGPNQYFNTLDVFSLSKIEVLRGSGSVQYGSDALGGTIQAFSKDAEIRAKPEWGGTLVTRLATHGMEQSLHAEAQYGGAKAAMRGGFTWRNFGDIVGGDTTGRQSPNGYNELDFDVKGKVLLSPSGILTIAFQNVHQSDIPVYHKIMLENYVVNKMDPQKRMLGYARINKTLNKGIWKSAIITLSGQRSEEGRVSRKKGSNIERIENDQVCSASFASEINTSVGSIWSATSGIEVYHDLVYSTRTDNDIVSGVQISKRGLYPDAAIMTSIASFTLHTFDFEEWCFTTGVRYNTYAIRVEEDETGKTRLTPSALVGNIAVMRKINTKSNVFISANTGFRAPNIDDLGTLGIVDFRYETPNFNLKPENSFQYQIGYKYRSGKLKSETFIYRNELYNLIVRNKAEGESVEGYPVYQKENVERAFIQGLETDFGYKFGEQWFLSGTLTYTYGQNITKNEPVRRIPPLFCRLEIEYTHTSWWCNFECQAAAKQDRLAKGDTEDNRIPAGGTPAWNIFNINAGYKLHFVKFDICIQNLLNQDYRYHGSGVNGYGRSALFSCSVKF